MRLHIHELTIDNTVRETQYDCTGKKRCRSIPASPSPGEADLACLVAHTGKTVCYEIALPAKAGRKATEEILHNELAERLPVDPESVGWFYRNDGNNRFVVCAVHDSEIGRVLRTAAERSLKFDRMVPAALAETPEELLRCVSPEPLPGEFRPARLRGWKAAYLILLLLSVAVLIPLPAGKYRAFAAERRNLAEVRESLAAELRKQRAEFGKLSADRELLEELRNARIGWNGVASALGVLTKRLPDSMWITAFAANDRAADLTISSAEDDANLYKTIGDCDFYSIVSLRKNLGADQRTVFTVKLRGNQIE